MLASVFVLNRHGRPLMPCHPAKARALLKQGKAKVVTRAPCTLRLLYGSSGYRQPVILGVDSGYLHVGLSAITANKEFYAPDIKLRDDTVKLNSERKQYRRARRTRHTWYRKPRFLNRKKPEGWLAPSIQNKLDTQMQAIDQVKQILPVSSIVIEVAAFDIQRIKNPEICGIDYQNGLQKDFWNVREYVLFRDDHKCQCCHGKDPVLEVHHTESRQTGGDRPENLITLCAACHGKASQGKLTLTMKVSKGFKAEAFMSTVRWKLVDNLRVTNTPISHTYGYLTKAGRIALNLARSHVNDAFVIAGGETQERSTVEYCVRQVRKCNRKLRKGDRSHIINTAPRFTRGFQRYDKVRWKGQECFILGRRASGYFDLRKLGGQKIFPSAKVSDIALIESAKTLLVERRGSGSSLCQEHRVSAA